MKALALLMLSAAAAAQSFGLPIRVSSLLRAFEENRGHAPTSVRYVARAPGYTVALTSSGAIIQPSSVPASRLVLDGARPIRVIGTTPAAGAVRYFRGDGRSTLEDVPRYARVRYRSAYEGIDVVFYLTPSGLEYDFELAAGADPKQIVMRFDNGRLDRGGIRLNGGVVQHPPHVYQQGRELRAAYIDLGRHRFGIRIDGYDPASAITIDPSITFATYYGGSSYEEINAMTVDSDGFIYVAGSTTSTDLPLALSVASPLNRPVSLGSGDAFIAKLSPDGESLIWAAYLGGSRDDAANSIGVDPSGNVYVSGWTNSASFPTTAEAYLRKKTGYANMFVAKLDPSGRKLLYSTLVGATGLSPSMGNVSNGTFLKVDRQGYVYLAGTTYGNGPAATLGAAITKRRGDADGFVLKLNKAGSALVYSTLIGGSDADGVYGMDIDSDGNAYVVGSTSSNDFPTVNAYLAARPEGRSSSFLAKLNSSGSAFRYSTYLGDGFNTALRAIAVDADGSAWVAGGGNSLPVVNPIWPDSKSTAGYLAHFDASGSSLLMASGVGTAKDAASVSGISLAPDHRLFLLLSSAPPDYFTVGSIVPPNQYLYSGLTCLDTEANRVVYSTGLPFSTGDPLSYPRPGFALQALPGDAALVAATANSSYYPATAGAFQTSFAGPPYSYTGPSGGDVFVARVSPANPAPAIDALSPSVAYAPTQGIAVYGSNFVSGAAVLMNGAPHAATIDTPAHITIPLAANEMAAGQTVSIQVVNPPPGGGASRELTASVLSRAPSDLSITPKAIAVGTSNPKVIVSTNALESRTVIRFDGQDRPMRSIPPASVELSLAAADVAQPGTHIITVVNPPPGGGSATASLLIGSATAAPALSSQALGVPLNATGDQRVLLLRGSGFVNGAKAAWDGAERPTTFTNSNVLQMVLTAEDVATPRRAAVTVINPDGARSKAATALVYMPLQASKLISDPNSGRIFASVGKGAPINANSNSIVRIEPASGAVETVIPLADNPGALAISPRGEYLYAAVGSSYLVQKIDLASGTAQPPFSAALHVPASEAPLNYPISAIQVSPSNPDTIAVHRAHYGLVMLDGGVQRPNDSVAMQLGVIEVPELAFTNGAILYPGGLFNGPSTNFPYGVYCLTKVQFNDWGLTTSAALCDGALDSIPEVKRTQALNAVIQNGAYYLPNFAPATTSYYDYPLALAVNPKLKRVYAVLAVGGAGLRVATYDQDTWAVLSTFDLPAYLYMTTVSLTVWGDDGVAVATPGDGKLYLWRDQ